MDDSLSPSSPVDKSVISAELIYDEDDDDDDDDEPRLPKRPPIFVEPKDDPKDFKRGDIIWMKVGKSFTPGIVVGASKKQHMARAKLVFSTSQDKAYKRKFSELIPFNNGLRNMRMLKEALLIDPGVQKPYDKVREFFLLHAQCAEICPLKFLLRYRNDKTGGIPASFYESSYDTMNSDEPSIKRFKTPTRPRLIDDSIFDILNDLDFSPVEQGLLEFQRALHAKPTEEEKEKMIKEAESLLKVIGSQKCVKHLTNLFKGKFKSERHEAFYTRKIQIQKGLMYSAGLGPFSYNRLGMELATAVDKCLKKIDVKCEISRVGNRDDYLFHVFIPEAVLFALQEVHRITPEEAQKLYEEQSYSLW